MAFGREKDRRELLAACRAGDAVAWGALISRHQGFIYGIALRCGMPPADADDVFQNVCLKLCLHLHELRDPERFLPWLAAVTRQECARLRRRAPDVPLENAETIETPDVSLDALLSEEMAFRVREGLTDLPERCQHLLGLLYGAEPQPYTEVARIMGMPLGSIGPQRGRCLERLRKKLEEQEGE